MHLLKLLRTNKKRLNRLFIGGLAFYVFAEFLTLGDTDSSETAF
jgi:hypothetical protein